MIFSKEWREIRNNIKKLESPEYDVRTEAVEALVKIGKLAVEALIKASGDKNKNVRKNAIKALIKINRSSKTESAIKVKIVPVLIKALEDSDTYGRVERTLTMDIDRMEPWIVANQCH